MSQDQQVVEPQEWTTEHLSYFATVLLPVFGPLVGAAVGVTLLVRREVGPGLRCLAAALAAMVVYSVAWSLITP